MSERKMTPKLFARAKLSGKITAEAFLAGHMEWLKTHTFLQPILEAYSNGEIFPTPTVDACKAALLDHVIAVELETAKIKMQLIVDKANKPAKTKSEREPREKKVYPYTITVYVKVLEDNEYKVQIGTYDIKRVVVDNGKEHIETETKDMIYSANMYQEAQGIADRRMMGREDSLFAEIKNNYGETITTWIQRSDSVARMLRGKKSPVCKEKPKSTPTLKWIGRARQSKSAVSRG